MSRPKIAAGNWKMNKTMPEAMALAEELKAGSFPKEVTMIVCPPYPYLPVLEKILRSSPISVGAQNCHEEPKGAYTGEVSASMIASLGIKYVIIGHSERRQYFKESNEQILSKIKSALSNGLIPIFCVGESLKERESGKATSTVKNQVKKVLYELSPEEMEKIIVAYEPVWAIGTGRTASNEQAQEMHLIIRKTIQSKFKLRMANKIPILYGGSVNAANAAELFKMPDVDGGLVGGASMVADDFLKIANSF
jgi:triosephosphate isomerase (TIM)